MVPVWKILQKLIFIRVSVTHSKRVAYECTDEVMDVGTWEVVILHMKPENNI